MPKQAAAQTLQRSTLQKLTSLPGIQGQLASLRLDHSFYSKLLTSYVNKLVHVNRVFPTHLPTQASFRWSTFSPAITNWPRQCINQDCVQGEHEWTDNCWSLRDMLSADDDEVMISWDHDNIEGKIHDLIVNDTVGIEAHHSGYDLHTITCCNIFGYQLPTDLRNPHTSEVDRQWRSKYNWQGKDTKQRVLAKNFNHGSKYTRTWRFVYRIPGVEQYGVSRDHLGSLARRYIAAKKDAWQRKLDIMQHIQRHRISRTLYGGRRVFFDSSEETGREGFSHMISGTVSDYNNETLILIEKWLGDDVRLLHNAHDGDKIAVKKHAIVADSREFLASLRYLIERPLTYDGRTLVMTAGIKIYTSSVKE